MALGLKYGSDEAIEFTDMLFDFMMYESIRYNVERGNKKGSFPMCDMDLVKKSEIYNNHNGENGAKNFRNCSLLSIAPTGSIATMMGGSGGTEPEFALSYTRRTDNLNESYKIESKVVKDYREVTGNMGELPDYFVCSSDINWRDRVDTQAVIQNHIDTAISSTVNLPKETTQEEIEELYLYAWSKGIKGITIFRDGCARLGILTTHTDEDEATDVVDSEDVIRDPSNLPRGFVLDASDDGIGLNTVIHSGCGKFYLNCKFDPIDGQPYEIFVNKGSDGSCRCNLEGITRLASYSLRGGCCIEGVVDQLKSVDACPSYRVRTATKHDTTKGASSCPAAIGVELERLYNEYRNMYIDTSDISDVGSEDTSYTSEPTPRNACPECGSEAVFEGGCVVCKSCGWSKCD